MNVHMMHGGRVRLVRGVRDERSRVADAATAAGVCVRTAHEWLARHRAGGGGRWAMGEWMLHDSSSAPVRYGHDTAPERIVESERLRMSGPAIARRLAISRSTVGAVLRRIGLGRLTALHPRPPVVRDQRERPGETIPIDTRKLGRIDGIGHRITGARTGRSNRRGTGREVLHVAVDDASRLAYAEVLASQMSEDAIAFLTRSIAFFARHGFTVERVMTDNGSAYKSHDFRAATKDAGLKHVRTRPHTPRTNGKAERFIQTSLRERASARAYQTSAERTHTMSPFLTTDDTARPHSALADRTPWLSLNNLLGKNS